MADKLTKPENVTMTLKVGEAVGPGRRWMDTGLPLATVLLSSTTFKEIDIEKIDYIFSPFGFTITDIRRRPGAWMATTDGVESAAPQVHLDLLTSFISENYGKLLDAVPGLAVAFSLLIFDESITADLISMFDLSLAKSLGIMTIELPVYGQELVFEGDSVLLYAA